MAAYTPLPSCDSSDTTSNPDTSDTASNPDNSDTASNPLPSLITPANANPDTSDTASNPLPSLITPANANPNPNDIIGEDPAPEAPAANARGWVMDCIMDLIGTGDVVFSYVSNIMTIVFSPGNFWVGIPLLFILSIGAFMWNCCIRRVQREVAPPALEVLENIIGMPALDTDPARNTGPASGTGPATRTGTDNEEHIIDIDTTA